MNGRTRDRGEVLAPTAAEPRRVALRDLSLAPPVYAGAQTLAAARGLTVEAWVVELVEVAVAEARAMARAEDPARAG